MMNGLLKKRATSVTKREDSSSQLQHTESDSEARKSIFGSKLRLSLSFKNRSGSSANEPHSASSSSSSKATPDNPHPYEDINNLPDRSRTQSRKSVTWKDPETTDLNEVLRARAKSVKGKDGRRTSLSWTQAPLQQNGT